MGSDFRFSSSGRPEYPDLIVRGRNFRLPSSSGTADFNLTEQELVVPQLAIRFLGGNLAGTHKFVTGWGVRQPATDSHRSARIRKSVKAFGRLSKRERFHSSYTTSLWQTF